VFGHVSLINSRCSIANQRFTSIFPLQILTRRCAHLRVHAGNLYNAILKTKQRADRNKGRKHHLLAGRKSKGAPTRRSRGEEGDAGASYSTPCIFIPLPPPVQIRVGPPHPSSTSPSGRRILAASLLGFRIFSSMDAVSS
jgi:hypothetical protein